MIEPHEIGDPLQRHHRDVLLDLILAWATLDGALGMMLSRVLGVPLIEGADIIGKMPASARLAKMRTLMLALPRGAAAADTLKKHKRSFERHSRLRNLVAHSNCVGFWKPHPEYVVFLTFKKASDDGLAIDAVPLSQMRRATAWGRAMTQVALQIADVPYQEDNSET